MRLLIKYPCRFRENRLQQCLENLLNNLENENTQVVVSIDIDDKNIYSRKTLSDLKKYTNTNKFKIFVTNSKSKVEAYNSNLDDTDWSHVIFMSDYVEFIKKGFDNVILDELHKSGEGFYPIQFYSSNFFRKDDGAHKLIVVPKDFYNKNKFVFNPVLKSNYHYELLELQLSNLYSEFITSKSNIHRYNHPKWGYENVDSQTINHLSNWKTDLLSFENERSIIY